MMLETKRRLKKITLLVAEGRELRGVIMILCVDKDMMHSVISLLLNVYFATIYLYSYSIVLFYRSYADSVQTFSVICWYGNLVGQNRNYLIVFLFFYAAKQVSFSHL